MRTFLLLLAILPLSLASTAQDISIEELEARKIHLEERIKILNDSLEEVENHLASLEQDENEQDLEPNEILLPKQVSLKKSTLAKSEILLELEEGTRVLKIDEVGEHYLICHKTVCGYVPTVELDTTKESPNAEKTL